MFASAVVRGIRLKLWKMKPILRLRTRERSPSSSSRTSTPSSQYQPRLGTSRQPMMFISVDLPEPDAPMMATNSPRATVSETPRRACTSTSPIA